MNRRQVVIFGLATALAGPAFASDFQDEIVASLRAQGYAQITVEVTLLGRVKITAMKQSNLREIVINPRTGEILRDLWLAADGSIARNPPVFEDLDTQENNKSDAGDEGSRDGSADDGFGNRGSDDVGGSDKDSDDDEDSGRDKGGERD